MNNNDDLISIIVPIYGAEKWISKCATSAFNQDYKNIEFIFINDATKDRSIDVLKQVISEYPKLQSKITIINNPENKGLAKSREIGVLRSNGDFIFHLDADDWIESDCISILYDLYQKYPDSSIITGNCRDIYKSKVSTRRQNDYFSIARDEALIMMERNKMWNIWNRLIRRELYDNLYIPPINNGEDYVTTIRLMNKASFCCFTSKITYNYNHLNENSFQRNDKNKSNIDDRVKSVLFLKDYFKDDADAQTSLEIGYFNILALNLINLINYKDIKNYSIPYKFTSILKNTNLKRSYKQILLLHKSKLYPLIWIINNIFSFIH